MSFWTKAPKLTPRTTDWTPGEPRSYIPVVHFGVPENTPAGGVVGRTEKVDGDRRVSFVVYGKKTLSTKARKP